MKYFALLLSAVLTAFPAFAFPTPGKHVPAECVDPTFACQDLQSARSCDVVKSCIHDVWATMTVPDDNDEVCDICKEMVKEARDQLLSNMTQEEIKEVFEGSCKLLPIKIVAEGCIKVVDEIIPELVEMLASRMDPTMVCTVSGMCFPSKINNVIENHILAFFRKIIKEQKETQCEECTKMLTDVQTFLKSTTESEAKADLEKLCHQNMPTYLCNTVINHYFHKLYNVIVTSEPVKLCSSVGVCPQKCDLKESKVEDELTCEFCEHVLEHIKDLMTTNTTEDEFKNALLNFCKQTGKFSEKCTSLVNEYFDKLFSYIKNLNSKGMCTLMGLCGNAQCSKTPLVKVVPAIEVRRKIPLIKLQPAEPVLLNDIEFSPLVKVVPANIQSKPSLRDSNDIFLPQLPIERLVRPYPLFEQDTECALCKAFTVYLETDLAGDRSKKGVRQTIDHICDKWMKDYPDHCSHIINKYSLKFEMAIANGISFEEMCSKVRACPLVADKLSELNVRVLPKVDSSSNDSPFCDLCKDAMNEVEKQLSDPATKKQLEDLLGQACKILPKSMRSDCVNFINNNVDALIDILEQELKPDTVCPALGLCPASLYIAAPQRVKDLECDVCKDVVTSFRQKLQDPASKKIIETFLEEGCRRLPDSVSGECKKFVVDNIDTLMKILIEETDPNSVCKILNICPKSVQKVSEQAPAVKDLECDLCKEVIEQVDVLIKKKETADEIQKALDKVCSYLPSSVAKQCENFVDEYSAIIINVLAQELDPAMVCAALKICPASVKKVETIEKGAAGIKDVECDLCKEVVGKVEDMVKDRKTEDEIRNALDKVCSYMPSSIATKCENFVNTYVETIILLIVQELDPALICAEINICPASVKKVEPVPKATKGFKDIECDLCKEVVGKLEDMVKDKKTEDEIRKALAKVCSYLPSPSLATKCENFVNKYTETLILLLVQELDPAMICAELQVCPETANFAQWKTKAVDFECKGCEYVFHFLQNLLMNAETQGELKDVLKKMCSVLPSQLAANCNAFVDQYGSALLVLLAQDIDPSSICYEVKMCQNQTISFEPQEITLESFHMDECSVCTTVVDYLDKLIEEDDVDKEITHLVEKVCNVLPASFRPKCTTVLEAYGPYILQMIGQLADSKQVCQEIDMCPRSPGQVHLIGGSKCTFGPSYWCRSQAHAVACKTESFCKEKVWKN